MFKLWCSLLFHLLSTTVNWRSDFAARSFTEFRAERKYNPPIRNVKSLIVAHYDQLSIHSSLNKINKICSSLVKYKIKWKKKY